MDIGGPRPYKARDSAIRLKGIAMIQVFGHKAPDTDSTGSPLIWAWYLTEIRKTPAKAVLQGTPNTEAVWMLGKWGVDMP